MAFDLLSFLLGKSTGSGGGGGSAALGPKTIRQNGVYRAASDNLDGYNTVTVEVPNTYAAADEGKVVSNGALVAQTSRTITENGTYDTTTNDEVVVNVSGGESEDIFDLSKPIGELSTTITNLSSIGARTGVTKVSAPNVTKLSENIFRGWTSLEEVYLPMVYNVNANYVFYGCSKLKGLVFNSQHDTGDSVTQNYFANNCPKLEYLDCHFRQINGNNCFQNDSMLNIIILRKTSGICTLTNINCFNNTPFASSGTGGTLYVPQALLSQYEQATNWATILGYTNNKILPIEGSIYENAYADGTPIA